MKPRKSRFWVVRRLSLVLAALFILFAALGCGGKGSDPSEFSTASGKIVIKPTSIVLGGKTRLVAETASQVTVSGDTKNVGVGAVLISKEGDGFLRKVTSIRSEGGNVIASTQQASFAEAFKEFKLNFKGTLGPAESGEIASGDPGLEFKWKNTPGRGDDDFLSVSMKELNLGDGVTITGEANFNVNPAFNADLVDDPSSVLPTFVFDASVSPELNTSVTLKSKFGGSISRSYKKEFKLKPLPVGGLPVVVVPVIVFSADVTGSGVAEFETSFTRKISGTLGIKRDVAKRLTPVSRFGASGTATASQVKGILGFTTKPVKVALEFRFYGVAGPYIEAGLEARAQGVVEVKSDGKEGVQLQVFGRAYGAVGVRGSVSLMKGLIDVEMDAFRHDYTIAEQKLFDDFFPFTDAGSVYVEDNGTSKDDIFEVSVDGTVYGRTIKGGSGSFRIGALRPGNRTLSVKCIEDDNPPGTVGISLSNGIKFASGATALADEINLGQTKTYTIVVPAQPTAAPHVPIPRSRVSEGSGRR